MKPTQKWYRCTKAFPGVEEGMTFRTVEAHITTDFKIKEDLDHVIHETFITDHPENFEEYDPTNENTCHKEPLNYTIKDFDFSKYGAFFAFSNEQLQE